MERVMIRTRAACQAGVLLWGLSWGCAPPTPPSHPTAPLEDQAHLREVARARVRLEAPGRPEPLLAHPETLEMERLRRGWGGVPRQPRRAALRYARRCQEGARRACAGLGAMVHAGDGTPQDLTRAEALYRTSCTPHARSGCAGLAVLLLARGALGYARAVVLFRDACLDGEPRGCANLGILYSRGAGVPERPALAADLLRVSCQWGLPEGCARLGDMTAHGIGTPRDPARAKALWHTACAEGAAEGCAPRGGGG